MQATYCALTAALEHLHEDLHGAPDWVLSVNGLAHILATRRPAERARTARRKLSFQRAESAAFDRWRAALAAWPRAAVGRQRAPAKDDTCVN